MLPARSGSFRLFQLFGIQVYMHWTWLLLVFMAAQLSNRYTNKTWVVVDYMALFGIVLMHEFGHSLACRSVGGQARLIALWPLGGVAYVQPPARPGALLWSIVAGPLVNVVLVPITMILWMWAQAAGSLLTADAQQFIKTLAFINVALLVFNLIPIYPLDGGQIVQALLWFLVGQARSLRIVAVFGLVFGAAGGLAALLYQRNLWMALIAVFIVMRAWSGFQTARTLAQMEARGLGHLVDERH